MKFFREHSSRIMRLFANQIGITFFALVLTMAVISMKNDSLKIVVSALSIVFYLFLIYNLLWNMGAKDAGRIARKESGNSRLLGLYMGLAASAVNFVIAVFIMLGNLLSDVSFFSNAGGIAATVGLLAEGMYTGLLAIRVGGVALNSIWPIWFIIPLPMIVTASLAYLAGSYEFRFFKPIEK